MDKARWLGWVEFAIYLVWQGIKRLFELSLVVTFGTFFIGLLKDGRVGQGLMEIGSAIAAVTALFEVRARELPQPWSAIVLIYFGFVLVFIVLKTFKARISE